MPALAIAGGISHTVARSVTRVGGLEGATVAMVLGVAGVVLLITNTMIVSTILCLIREVSVRTVWSSMQLSAVPYYLAGGVIANIWVRANFTANSGLAVIAVLSVYLLSVSYRELSSRIASA